MTELNYHHLRYFQVVAHEGNLTRAAERLNVAQSALSSQIRQLEERLGHSLFERRGRALHLTEAGRIALDHADVIFAAGKELVATLRQSGFSRRALRVGALATLSRNFQLQFLRPVLGRSDVDVVLRSGSVEELLLALTSHHIDLLLTNQAPQLDATTPFVIRRLNEQPVSLIGAPHFARHRLSLRDHLAQTPLILPGASSGIRLAFDALVDRLRIDTQILAEVDDIAMMRLIAREGVGIAIMPPIAVLDELSSGVLVEIEKLDHISETFYGIVVKRRFPNPILADLFERQQET